MFLIQRPSMADITRFLDASRELPLSYGPIGIIGRTPAAGRFDEYITRVGSGPADFERARDALMRFKQFDIGWVETFPRDARAEPGTVVAVLIRHLGFWSLNGARVLYHIGATGQRACGFAYGTLTNHAESGEELFDVFIDGASGDIRYRIRAVSRPQSALTWIGQPVVRVLQARFRRDSASAMQRVTSDESRP